MAISKQVEVISVWGSPPCVIKNGDDTKIEDGVVYVDVYSMGNFIQLNVEEAEQLVEELKVALGTASGEPLVFDDTGFTDEDASDDTSA